MPRLIWMVLHDGRSVVAGCGSATRDYLESAIAEPERVLTLTSDDGIEKILSHAVRDFVLFDSRTTIPAAGAIYRLVQF